MTLDVRAEVARGYLLIGIFYIHILTNFARQVPDSADAASAFLQIKLLAPHVATFFFLAGFGARRIGTRPFASVATQSLMLLIVASASHAIGYWIGPFWHAPPANAAEALRQFVKPLVIGTGYATFVAWFFVVLAGVRLLAWCIGRGWRTALIGAAVAVAVVALGGLVFGTRNLLEWRSVPVALVLFLIGSRWPREWRVPAALGLAALPVALASAWFNRPALLTEGPCLDCDILFVGQPSVGGMGAPPLYLVQELAFLLFLLWGSQFAIGKRFGNMVRFFGHHSMQLLLLHGWVMAALFPLFIRILPQHGSAWLFVALLVGSAAFHAALLLLLRPWLDRFLALCFAAARWLVALPGARPWRTPLGRAS